jgi:16S rRNA (adenine1518-N6/adenine1519-N6)-dimethyltransferase
LTYHPHQPRKRFGQNFLHDANILRNMVAAIAPEPGQKVIEIGPGRGALTFPLLEQTGTLTVVELDRDLIEPLRARAAEFGELTIHNVDALRFDFAALAAADQPLRIVGNLPYNISTPLIFHLLQQAEVIHDMHFLLQKEVVDRMAAAPGGKEYGRLSIMVQYHCRVEPLFGVGPGAFYPPPKVDSAFVRLIPHKTLPIAARDPAILEKLVRQAFSQRRKTLRRSLKSMVTETLLQDVGIDPGNRPEQISISDFVNLANALANKGK